MIFTPAHTMERNRQLLPNAIQRERAYQDWKWGDQITNPHHVHEWLAIIVDELREAIGASELGRRNEALVEILQVIAVGVACLEQHGVFERHYPDDAVRIFEANDIMGGLDKTGRP